MIKRFFILLLVIVAAVIFWNAFFAGALVDGGWLKAAITPLAIIYLNAFNDPSTAIGLCVGMVLAAIFFLAYYWLGQIAPTVRELANAAYEIRWGTAPAGTRAAFVELDGVLMRYPRLRPLWSAYRSTVSAADVDLVRSQTAPSRYLNMTGLEVSGLRLRFFLSLPNDFVGLGLMFTFLGLVAGLYFATQSMMSADLTQARSALVLLLHAATFKFLTSITGIGLSLVLNWVQGAMVGQIRLRLYDLQMAVEERLPVNAGAAVPQSAVVEPLVRPGPVASQKFGIRHIP